jgi:small subunit ribosomal protein S14
MAKTALINRDQKRRDIVKKFAVKRAELLAITRNVKLSQEERYEARMKLQELPRDASPVRLRNRCALTGRPRGVYPQVRARAGQVARHRDARRNSWRDQGELVAGRI